MRDTALTTYDVVNQYENGFVYLAMLIYNFEMQAAKTIATTLDAAAIVTFRL